MTPIAVALQAATQHQQANRIPQAQQIYQQILAKQPYQPDALHGLGVLAQQVGQYQAAENLFGTALRVQPNSLKVWFSLGNLRQVQGQLPEATEAYQKALTLAPQAVPIYNNLGYTLQLQEKLDEAIACYRKALELQPGCVEVEANLGKILNDRGLLSSEEKGRHATLNYDLGTARQKAGDLKTAAAYYRQAIALNPELTIAHYLLGNALQGQNQLEEALSCYRKVLELGDLKPEAVGVCAQLARVRANGIERQLDKPNRPERLKVAFICQPGVMSVFPNPTDSLGILTDEFARLLVQDCDVTVYVPSQKFREERHSEVLFRYIPIQEDRQLVETLATIDSLEPPETPSVASNNYFPSYILRVARHLERDRVDIAHIWTFSQFIPILKSIAPEIKTVLHLEDELLLKLDRSLVETRLSQTDLILACSNYMTDKLQQRFPKFSSQFKTLYNGANVDRFIRLSSAPQKPDRTAKNGAKRLLFIGRICPEKGSHILLEAFQNVLERYPKTQLHLIGTNGVIPYEFGIGGSEDPIVTALEKFHCDGAWADYFKAYLSQLKKRWGNRVGKQLFFPGLLPQPQLVDYYHNCDIFIFPSVWHEPFGMPIVEAMVAGVPVIATWGGAFPELIEDGKTGLLVERGNVEALAEAIERLLGDEPLRESIARTARERALDLFSFEKVTEDLLSQYQHLGDRLTPDSTKMESVAPI